MPCIQLLISILHFDYCVFIESLPPLFSEVCIDSTMTTKISEQHSGNNNALNETDHTIFY